MIEGREVYICKHNTCPAVCVTTDGRVDCLHKFPVMITGRAFTLTELAELKKECMVEGAKMALRKHASWLPPMGYDPEAKCIVEASNGE